MELYMTTKTALVLARVCIQFNVAISKHSNIFFAAFTNGRLSRKYGFEQQLNCAVFYIERFKHLFPV